MGTFDILVFIFERINTYLQLLIRFFQLGGTLARLVGIALLRGVKTIEWGIYTI